MFKKGFAGANFEIINTTHLTMLIIDELLMTWAFDGGWAKFADQIYV